MTELQAWKDAVEMMMSHLVIPRRSVDRVRRALAEHRNPEPYLRDIKAGLAAAFAVGHEMDDRPSACPHCLGTGHVLDAGREDARS